MPTEKPGRVMTVVPTPNAITAAQAGDVRFWGHSITASQVIEFPEDVYFQHVSSNSCTAIWTAILKSGSTVSLIYRPQQQLTPWMMIAPGPVAA